MRPALALLLLSLVAFAPPLFSAEWLGTEARRVEIAREMVVSGDWMVPTLGGEPTLAKPPLYYWLLAAVQSVGGRSLLVMRLPSVLAVWLLALVCFRALRRVHGAAAGWICALGVLLSPVVLAHGAHAEIDNLFAALTGISIVWLAEGAAYGRRGQLALAGLVGGLALLTKGPPYLMFVAGPVLVWLRRLGPRGLLFFLGALLLPPLAYYLPLLLAVVSPDEFLAVASKESVGRMSTFTVQHVLDTPLFVLRAGAAVLPLALWSFHEYRGAGEMREAVVDREELFLRLGAAAFFGAVLLLVLFPSRPARYLLPGIPCFLLAVSPAVAAYVRFSTEPTGVLSQVIRVVGVVGAVGVLAAPWIQFPYGRYTPLFVLGLALAPLLVRGRRHMVAYMFLVPLLAAWTVLPDRTERRAVAPRGREPVVQAVLRELEARDALDDLSTYGHVAAEILVALTKVVPGDEQLHGTPTSRWLLLEEVDDPDPTAERFAADVEGYTDRLRVRLYDRTLVLRERT